LRTVKEVREMYEEYIAWNPIMEQYPDDFTEVDRECLKSIMMVLGKVLGLKKYGPIEICELHHGPPEEAKE